jgi:hypothetical protein
VNIVVSPLYIELGKEGTSTEAINSLWDQWGYISVLFCPFVDRTVVLNWLPLPILLLDKEEICYIRAL